MKKENSQKYEDYKKHHREYYRTHKLYREKVIKRSAQQQYGNTIANSTKVFKHLLKKNFNKDLEWYKEKFDSQDGRCAICGTITKKRLCVDHDHETCKIRGLLCHQCNLGLGNFKDSKRIIESALVYLKTFSEEEI